MNLVALLDRLDDWINPIVVKELRQAVKARLVVVIMMVFLALMLLVMGGALMYQEAGGDVLNESWSAGTRVFTYLQMILLPTLMLVVPVYAAVRMSGERSDTNVDLLFISTLSPSAIISGKFVASLMLAVLIFSIFAPFMTFTYLLRGIDLPTIAFILWIDVMAMLGATIIALFLASVPGPRALKVFVNFGGFLGLFFVYCGLAGITGQILYEPGFLNDKPEVIWVTVAAVSTLVLMEGLLVYYYSVAMISPPSSNRILPVRICLIAYWVATGAVMFWWSANATWLGMTSGDHIPVAIWVCFAMFNLCIQFLLSTCERDEWGPRMARSIPKNPLLRLPAFFLYTGAAGGVLLTVGMMAATLLLGLFWYNTYPPAHFHGRNHPLEWSLSFWGAIGLYTVCYGLTAALVRSYFLRDQIRSAYTWVLAALFVGIGSFVPSAIAYLLFYEQVRTSHETGWWMLANPFMAGIEMTMNGTGLRGGNDLYLTLMWWFLATWAVLVAALSVFWIGGQMRRFQHYERRAIPPALRAEPIDMPALRAEPVVDPAAVRPVTPG